MWTKGFINLNLDLRKYNLQPRIIYKQYNALPQIHNVWEHALLGSGDSEDPSQMDN
jgi:hypothetical protein